MSAVDDLIKGHRQLGYAVKNLNAAWQVIGTCGAEDRDVLTIQISIAITDIIKCMRALEETGLIPADDAELREIAEGTS